MTDFDPVLVLIDRTLPRVRKAAVNMANGMDHHPSSGNGGGSTKGSHSDPVGRLAERHAEPWGRDQAAIDHTRLTRLISELADLVDGWAPNNQARAHVAGTIDGPPGCTSCARAGTWNPIHNSTGMCLTCIKITARVAGRYDTDGTEPPKALVEMGRRGIRITDREIDRVMHGKKRRD